MSAVRCRARSEFSRDEYETALAEALEQVNMPVLLMVLYQLTGQDDWLRPPYLPSRHRGMDMNQTGELDPEAQQRMRHAAARALMRWWDDGTVAVEAPQGDELCRLMSVCVGEDVPADFEPMMAELLRTRPRPAHSPVSAAERGFDVTIIGAGVSGLLLGRSLKHAAIPFRILEKNDDVGGTWLENDYPGCGVDTPSHLYSFTFKPYAWGHHFARRDEVLAYVREMADEEGLLPHIEFGTRVESATFNEDRQRWILEVEGEDGHRRQRVSNVAVSAVGQLNQPKIPSISGMESFEGTCFHSSRWPAALSTRELEGHRVSVVGSGASAMQIVPAIADSVASLQVIQRSPHWVTPNADYFRSIDETVQFLFQAVPFYYQWYRLALAWTFNDKAHPTLYVDPDWEPSQLSINRDNHRHREALTKYLESELEGRPDLIAQVTPDYPPFGKRMLLDNGWFRALRRPNVDLATAGVSRMLPDGLELDDGRRVPADIVVFATGFRATRMVQPMEVVGSGGRVLAEVWDDDDPRAYLGMSVPGFPNFFLMYGPNTNLGHGGSYISVAECQAAYITRLLVRMTEAAAGVVECRVGAERSYTERLDQEHARMIWAHPGMDNWYKNDAGRVVSNMPWRVVDYWNITAEPDLEAYHLVARS